MEPGPAQALIRLAGALLVEQDDEWLVGRRYLSAESIALVLSQTVQTERSLSLEKITEEVTELPAAA